MKIATYKTAIYDWISKQVPKGTTIVWEAPNADRPPNPYLNIKLIGPSRQGHDQLRSVEANPTDFRIIGNRSFVLQIDSFGDTTQQIMSDLQSSLSNPDAIGPLRAAGLAFGNETGIINLTQLVDTVWEIRYHMEINFLAHEDLTVKPGVIDKAKIVGDVTDGDSFNKEVVTETAVP